MSARATSRGSRHHRTANVWDDPTASVCVLDSFNDCAAAAELSGARTRRDRGGARNSSTGSRRNGSPDNAKSPTPVKPKPSMACRPPTAWQPPPGAHAPKHPDRRARRRRERSAHRHQSNGLRRCRRHPVVPATPSRRVGFAVTFLARPPQHTDGVHFCGTPLRHGSSRSHRGDHGEHASVCRVVLIGAGAWRGWN